MSTAREHCHLQKSILSESEDSEVVRRKTDHCQFPTTTIMDSKMAASSYMPTTRHSSERAAAGRPEDQRNSLITNSLPTSYRGHNLTDNCVKKQKRQHFCCQAVHHPHHPHHPHPHHHHQPGWGHHKSRMATSTMTRSLWLLFIISSLLLVTTSGGHFFARAAHYVAPSDCSAVSVAGSSESLPSASSLSSSASGSSRGPYKVSDLFYLPTSSNGGPTGDKLKDPSQAGGGGQTEDSGQQDIDLVCRVRKLASSAGAPQNGGSGQLPGGFNSPFQPYGGGGSGRESLNFSLISNERTRSLRVICDDSSTSSSSPSSAQNLQHQRPVFAGGATSHMMSSSSSVISESRLENGSLSHLVSLRALTLEGCHILELNGGSFVGLSSLRNLTVHTHNAAWGPLMSLSLTYVSLSHLPSLTRLDLSWNNMAHLPADLFCPLSTLKTLNLSHNRLTAFNSLGLITSTGRLCLEELNTLDMSHNRLTFVSPTDISALRNLKVLKLQGNAIRELAPLSLSFVDLEIIDLSSNSLTRIPRALFHKSERLQEIHIHNNSISQLPNDAFRYLNELRVLNMSHNRIASDQFTSFDIFLDLIRLQRLDLSHNTLTTLNGSTFTTQYSLSFLDLSHNYLTAIHDGTFSQLYNLQELVLSHNQITGVSDMLLNSAYVLRQLDLSFNDLHTIGDRAFYNCSELRHMNLYGNFLATIPVALASTSLGSLHFVNLGNNKLSPTALVAGRPLNLSANIHELILRENALTNFTQASLATLPALKRLDLSQNQLTNEGIGPNPFDHLYGIESINLAYNGMENINSLFPKLERLIRLNVSHNEINWFDWALIPYSLLDLDLSHNRIEHLGNYFELDQEISVRTVDMSHNLVAYLQTLLLPGSVRKLNMSHNLLSETTLAPYVLNQKVNLTSVDFSFNRFTAISRNHLTIGTTSAWAHLTHRVPSFYLAGNPYNCDCNLEWLQKMVIGHAHQHHNGGGHRFSHRLSAADSIESDLIIADLDAITCTPVAGQHHLSTGVVTPLGVGGSATTAAGNSTGLKAVPVSSVQVGNLLCPYRTHCFALCHCCDFDACDCEMTCPDNCSCWSDRTWATNVVDCSSMGHGQVPARVPMDVTELYLDGNYIHVMESHVLIGRKNMQILRLNNSRISFVAPNAFNGLKVLQVLNLNHNEITSLSGVEFEGKSLPALRELYLSYNRIQSIANGTFATLWSLQVLHLDHNYLTRVAPWDLLPPAASSRLYEIRLSSNPYSCECGYIRDLSQWLIIRSGVVTDVYQVSCYHNETTQYALVRDEQEPLVGGPSRMGSRYGLNFARPVSNIEKCSTPSAGSRESGLVVGSSGTGSSNPSLIGGRPTASYQPNQFYAPPPPQAIPTVGGNGLVSGAGSDLLLSTLNDQRTAAGAGGLYPLGTGHQSGSASSGSQSSTSSSIFTSQSYLPLALIGTVILLCVFCTGLGFIVYRQELALWFYSRYGVRLGRSASSYGTSSSGSGSSSRDDEEKLFDAFVSYSKKDEAFVTQMLAPELEYGTPNYRLCLHYRDLPVAAGYLYDAIVEAMEASRRTILIISDNFLESEWCRYGFKSAHHEVLRNARHRLIIIDIGRMTNRELDPEMRAWLKSNTYIQWGEKMFWQKLRYAMPDVPYSSGRKPGDTGPLGGQTLHIYARAR